MNPDDERLGQLFRLLRSRAGLTQEEIAIATSIPVRDIRRLEHGRVANLVVGRVRTLYSHVGARARLSVWWNGAAADRLLDEKHAAIAERGAVAMTNYGWTTPTEVTYSDSASGDRSTSLLTAKRQTPSLCARLRALLDLLRR